MSFDPNSPYQPPLGAPGAPPRSRSRGIFLGLGIGCGVLLLLCCGGFAGVTWWGSSKLKESTSEDPVVINNVAAQIAEVPLPPTFQPQYSLNMVVPFTAMKIKGAIYTTKQNGFFLIGEFDAKMSDADREKFLQQMRAGIHNNANDKLDILESKTVELKMRGKDASFKYAKAENQDTKAKLWQIMGTFHGKEGPAMILMIVPLEQFKEEQITQMLEKSK